jgi:hypothetical protein
MFWPVSSVSAASPRRETAGPIAASGPAAVPAASGADDRCTPPAFAVAIGHAEKSKPHNNCK